MSSGTVINESGSNTSKDGTATLAGVNSLETPQSEERQDAGGLEQSHEGGSSKRQRRELEDVGGPAAGAPVAAGGRGIGIGALPDGILGLVFDEVHRRSHSFTHAIACRHWKEVAFAEQHVLFVKPPVPTVEMDLLHELKAFSSLTALHIGKKAVWKLTNRLLAGIPKACPHLRKLRIRPDASRHPGYPSVSGLHALASSLPDLTSLMFETTSYVVNIKDPFPPLTGVTSLELAEGGYGNRKVLGSGWGSLGPVLPAVATCTALRRLLLELKKDDLGEVVGHLRMLTCLTYKSQGSHLPASLGELTQLRKLELASNATGIPESCSRLSSLTWLSLRLRISALPPWIGELSQLKTLQVAGSLWEDLPPQLWSLSSLTTLHLCSNPLEIPEEISSLRALENLKLQSECTGPIPDSLSTLQSLSRIEVSTLFAESLLPHLEVLTNLQLLHINLKWTDCLEEQAPRLLASLPRLRSLHAAYLMGLSTCLQIPSPLPSLRTLSLSQCRPRDLDRALPMLGQVECVKLAVHNSFQHRQSLDLEHLTSAVKLHVNWHNLTRIQDGVSKLTQLKDLTLERGRFMQLPESFSALCSLDKLQLNYCPQFATFPASFGALPRLATLNLVQLGSLRTFPGSFRTLQRLRTLVVLDCRLAKFAFDHLPLSLRLLSIKNGFRRSRRISSRIGELENLQILELAEHSLVQLPDSLGGLRNLRQLDLLRLRRLTGLPDSLSQLTALRDLEVDQCACFREVPAGVLELPSLSEVSKRGLGRAVEGKVEEVQPQPGGGGGEAPVARPDNAVQQEENEDEKEAGSEEKSEDESDDENEEKCTNESGEKSGDESGAGAEGNRDRGMGEGSGIVDLETYIPGESPAGLGSSSGNGRGCTNRNGAAAAQSSRALTPGKNDVHSEVDVGARSTGGRNKGEEDGGTDEKEDDEEDGEEDDEEDVDDECGEDEEDGGEGDREEDGDDVDEDWVEEEDGESGDGDDGLVLVEHAHESSKHAEILHQYEDLENAS